MRFTRSCLIAFLLTTLAGFGLHYLYDWFPGVLSASVGVVRESLWEHTKLLFWPYLICSLVLARYFGYPLRPRLLTLLVLCAVLLSVSYWYHILLGGESVAVDITLYLFLMVCAFLLPGFLPGDYKSKGWRLLMPLTVLLALLLILFTFLPPDHILFQDLSGANTWSQIPC